VGDGDNHLLNGDSGPVFQKQCSGANREHFFVLSWRVKGNEKRTSSSGQYYGARCV
jgi:hypothetical protein